MIAWVLVWFVGCGGAPAPEAEPVADLTPVQVDPAAVANRPPPERTREVDEAGPGGLSADVAAAYETAFADARRLRCAVPDGLGGDGVLEAAIVEGQDAWMRALRIGDGWLSAVADEPFGTGVLRRDGAIVALVKWNDADKGTWTGCTVSLPETYEILGLVKDHEDDVVAGVTVRSCIDLSTSKTNASGRFSAKGVIGAPCPMVGWVDEAGGLGRTQKETIEVLQADEDAIVELELQERRLDAEGQAGMANRLQGLLDRVARNGVELELKDLEERVAGLEGAPAEVGAAWVADLKARVDRDRAIVDALAKDAHDGLLYLWTHEL